jgi:NADPH2:quinone reductase
MKVVRVYEPGGPEQLKYEDAELRRPLQGEVVVRHTAMGLNLIDVYHRTATSGQYAITRPAVLGIEAVGIVEEVGPAVDSFAVGDRVGYLLSLGAYSEQRVIKASELLRVPDFVPDAKAAAGMVRGVTAQYLLTRIYPVNSKSSLLVHGATGGVGQLMIQMAKHLGARVIAAVSSPADVAIAKSAGSDDVVVIGERDFAPEVRSLTGGRGVDVAYDSVGKDTFFQSLDSLRPLGMIVNYGQSSGPVPPIDPGILAQKGSVFLSKPTLATFNADAVARQELADAFFAALKSGVIDIPEPRRIPLADVAQAHRDLEARLLTGPTVLVP